MHIIRLRGPWQVKPLGRFVPQVGGSFKTISGDLPVPARVTMPADWAATVGADFLGRVRYTRSFHKPTGLDLGERVFLVVEPPRSRGVVELNRKRLGDVSSGAAPLRVDVTDLLGGDERLEIVVEHDEAGRVGGLVGEVWLEIED